MPTRLFCTLFAVFVAVSPSGAQESLPPAGETIEVSIVNVDVVVTDRRGNRIRGLQPSDFEIRDNGVVQTITNFAEYSEPAGSRPERAATVQVPSSAILENGAAATDEPRREKHTLVVFVDRMILTPRNAEDLIASLKKLLHDTIRPGDSAAIVTYRYAMKVQQEFTGDLSLLDRACDKLRVLFDRVGEDPESEAIRNAYFQELLDETQNMLGDSLLFNGYEGARRAKIELLRKYSSMSLLANLMAAVEGRKSFLAVTQRLSQYAGAEFFAGGVVPAQYSQELDMREEREKFIRDANAARVSVYTVYPTGLVSSEMSTISEGPRRNIYRSEPALDVQKMGKGSRVLLNETAALGEIAKKTGGTMGWGLTDVAKVVNEMRSDLGFYYSLAFRSPQKSSTHKIVVTTKNRSYVVRARQEYVEKTDLMQMTDRIVSSLYQPQRSSTLPVDVQVLAITKKGKRYHIPLVVRVAAAALTTIPGEKGASGSFRVYAAAGGQLGIMSAVHERSQPFTIPAAASDRATKVFTYEIEMVTDARADRIVVGIYDELSHQYGVTRVKLNTLPTVPSTKGQ